MAYVKFDVDVMLVTNEVEIKALLIVIYYSLIEQKYYWYPFICNK